MKFTIRCERCNNTFVQHVDELYSVNWFCDKCKSDENTRKMDNKKILKEEPEKIQSPQMLRDISYTRDVSVALIQGGKAIGDVFKPKNKKNRRK
jgi:hypothetical protein